MTSGQHEPLAAALARLPRWEVPPGFTERVSGMARMAVTAEDPALVARMRLAALLRGAGIAALVSVSAWLGGEMLLAGFAAAAGSGRPGPAALVTAALALGVVWKLAFRRHPFRA